MPILYLKYFKNRKKMSYKLLVINLMSALFICMVGIVQPVKAQDQKPKIAVSSFVDKTDKAGNDEWYQKSPGDNMADMLTTALVKSRNYRVMERGMLASVLSEQDLQVLNSMGPTQDILGKLEGVDYLVYGSVTEFGYSTGGNTVGKGKFRLKSGKHSVTVGIDIRVVDVKTAEIVDADNFRAENSKKAGGLKLKDFDVSGDNTYDQALVDETIREAIGGLVDLLDGRI